MHPVSLYHHILFKQYLNGPSIKIIIITSFSWGLGTHNRWIWWTLLFPTSTTLTTIFCRLADWVSCLVCSPFSSCFRCRVTAALKAPLLQLVNTACKRLSQVSASSKDRLWIKSLLKLSSTFPLVPQMEAVHSYLPGHTHLQFGDI